MSSSNPPSDDIDRDALYSSDAMEDDDADYELEPPDPEVTTVEQRLTAERLAAAARSLDDDELLREDERRLDIQLIDELMGDFRFQFQIKHMLWATAALALLVAIAHYSFLSSILVGVLISVGGVLTFLSWKEKQHEAVVAERRRQAYARRQVSGNAKSSPSDTQPSPESAALNAPRPSFAQQLFSICSHQELLIASAVAIVLLALLGSVLGLAVTASCLGILGLLGVIIQAVGVDMPRKVVLSLWAMLVLYILLSVFLVLTSSP